MLHPVSQLSIPAAHASESDVADSEAVQLFLARAASARPGFEVGSAELASVARICRRVDGLPLAVELAAARVRALSVLQIADRLDESFALLADARRGGLAHHRTLRATIDWSYQLLDDAEREVLRRLAVFAGGFGVDAAEAICSLGGIGVESVLDLVMRLADKSLVVVDVTPSGMRHRLLESIREYALEHAEERGETAATRDAHLRWYADFAERAEEEMHGPDDVAWLDAVALELDNVRAAADWATAGGGAGDGLRLLGRLWVFWWGRGRVVEGRHLLDRALRRADGAPSVATATAHAAASFLCGILHDRAGVERHATASIDLAAAAGGGPSYVWSSVWATLDLSVVAEEDGDLYAAQELALRAMAISRERPSELPAHRAHLVAEARSHQHLAFLAAAGGDLEGALAHAAGALDLCQRLGNKPGISRIYSTLGQLNVLHGDLTAAGEAHELSLYWARAAGDRLGIWLCHQALGALAYRQGLPEQAREHYDQGLATAHDMGMPPEWEAKAWQTAGEAAREHGDTEAAQRWLGVAARLAPTAVH